MMTPYDTGETKEASEMNDASTDRSVTEKPSRQEAEAAVDVLLRWIGENPALGGVFANPAQKNINCLSLIHISEPTRPY